MGRKLNLKMKHPCQINLAHENDYQQNIVHELHGLHESFSLAKNKNPCNLCNSWIKT